MELSLMDHLRELRKRMIVSFVAFLVCTVPAYLLYDQIFAMLTQPLKDIELINQRNILYVTSVFEGFNTKIRFSIIFGLIFSLPIHIYQLLRFIFPGLKTKEKRMVLVGLFSSFLLGLLGIYVVYFNLLPYSAQFLINRDFIPQNVGVLLNYTQNMFYIFNFLVYSILLFQFPIILTLLLYLNIVSRKSLWKSSRYAVVFIFVVAAVVTPPDVISLIGVALPLTALFFLTLGISRLFRWGEA